MDADWYEDPLGRYDGRFFDGERWTQRVSANGILATDPEFLRDTDEIVNDPTPAVVPVGNHPPSRPTPPSTSTPPATSTPPSIAGESPVRVVAVLDESVLRTAAPRQHQEIQTKPARRGARRVLIAGVVGLALIAIAAVIVTRSDDAAPDSITLDQAQVERVEDLEAGAIDQVDPEDLNVDTAAGPPDPDARFDPEGLIEVGALRVVNGTSALAELAAWHQGFVESSGREPGVSQGCWFGQLGDAAVQVAHCGPVSGSADTEYLFDLVPIDFADVENGQLAQPVIDSVTQDAVIANAVTLIGSPGGPVPPQ